MVNKFYRLNQYITADQVRVVDEKGKQIGVLPLTEALAKARQEGKDLVEVAAKAKPPVCKIINFKKFKYLETKKQQEEKKKNKKIEIKQIRLTPFMAENDFNFRLKRAKEFLNHGDWVKLTVFFRGRQITKKNFGYELIKKAETELEAIAKKTGDPKFMGKQLEVLFLPVKGEKNDTKNENQKVNQQKV